MSGSDSKPSPSLPAKKKRPVRFGKRTLMEMRAMGYLPWKVEVYNHRTRKSNDLFGIIDYLGIKPGSTLAVQVCAWSDVLPHMRKIQASPNYPMVVASGWRFEVWGYKKRQGRYVRQTVDMVRNVARFAETEPDAFSRLIADIA